MSNMRIAVIDPSGFTIPYDHHLCNALADAGCSIRLYTNQRDSFWQSEGTLHYDLVTSYYNTTQRLFDVKSSLQLMTKGIEHVADTVKLFSTLRQWNPDVIHFQWFPLPLIDWPALSLFESIAPIVATVHDPTPFHGNSSSAIQQLGAKHIYRKCTHLITHTPAGRKELLQRGQDTAKISVIPHGVLDYRSAVDQPTDDCVPPRSEERPYRVLLFGAMKPYKGIDVAIRSLAALDQTLRTEVELVVAGPPKMDIAPLKKLAAELGVDEAIRWEDRFIPHMAVPSLFESAEVLALPYRQIDQSGVLMSMLPFGLPLVATTVGGFETVLEDGVHGRLVPPEDPAAFAAALEEVLRTADKEAMQDAVTRLAAETYSWQAIADQTRAVYESVRRTGE